jgi:hypothetical protein
MREDPLNSRILRKGVIYRVPAPPSGPQREHDPETLEIIRRGREKAIREYFEKKKRAP